jgi:hypothetical protein
MAMDFRAGAGGEALFISDVFAGHPQADPALVDAAMAERETALQELELVRTGKIALGGPRTESIDVEDWLPEHEVFQGAPESNSGYDQERVVEFDDSYDMERGF